MNTLEGFPLANLSIVVERVGWVLLHSVWQFALLAILSALVIRSLQQSSANIRYSFLVFAMASVVFCPVVTWYLQGPVVTVANEFALNAKLPRTEPLGQAALLPQVAKVEQVEKPIESPERDPKSLAVVASHSISEQPLSAIAKLDYLRALNYLRATVRPWLYWIVAIWSLGVVVCAARPALSWLAIQEMRRNGTTPVSEEMLEGMRRVARKLGVTRSVQLFQSTRVQVPVVLGYLRPMILLPVSLLSSMPLSQLEAILAHELAHVRRHDFLVNLLQTVVETLFFYHPAVWWLSHRIRIEREHCCDDLVIVVFENRVEYGRALVAIEQLRGQCGVLALGVSDGSMLARIRRIVTLGGSGGNKDLASRWSIWNLIAASLSVVALTGLFCWQGMAQSAPNPTSQTNSDETKSEKPQNDVPGFTSEGGPAIQLPDFLNVRTLGFSSDNQRLVCVSTKDAVTIRTWNIAEQKLLSEVQLDRAIDGAPPLHGNQFLMSGLKLSRDLTRLLGCVQDKVRIWNAESGKLVLTLPNPARDGGSIAPRGLTSTPNFDIIAAAMGLGFGRSKNCEVAVWQGVDYGRIKRLTHTDAIQITSLAISADGNQLASGSQNATTCVFDLATSKLLYTLPNSNGDRTHPDSEVTEAGANQILCLAFSPDGKRLAIGDMLGIKIVNAADGELIRAIESPFRFGMSGLLFSNDGKLLARTASDNTVPIWSTETGKLISELPTEAHDAAFSIDGQWLATGFSDEKQALTIWKRSIELPKSSSSLDTLSSAEVEKTVLAILRTPFTDDPSRGSLHEGAHETQILSQLGEVPQRINVIKTLLKVVDRTESATPDERRLAMLFLSGADPKNLVPLLRKAIEAAEKVPSKELNAYDEIETLGRIGEDARSALPLLIRLLDNKDPTAYDLAVGALGKIGARSPDVMNELAKHTDDPLTVYQLARYGKIAKSLGPQFVKLLDSPVKEIRTWAAQALVRSGFDEARGLDVLTADVAAGISEDRCRSATALAALGSQAAAILPRLQQFVDDPDLQVSEAVGEAIRRIEQNDRVLTHAEEATQREAAREVRSALNPRHQFNVRLVGGDAKVPLDGIDILATEGYGDSQKKYGPFKTDASGTANCSLPQGFYTLHLSSPKEFPYLPWEKYWKEKSPPGRHGMNVRVTGTGVEKWLGGNPQEHGVEQAQSPNDLTRITFTLVDPIELVLRAVDVETGQGLSGAIFYLESAVAEDWAHSIDGANIGADSHGDRNGKSDEAEYQTDADGYFRRFVSEAYLRTSRDDQWGPKYGVSKSPPGYEAVAPGTEVDIDPPVGKRRVEHVFRFRKKQDTAALNALDQSLDQSPDKSAGQSAGRPSRPSLERLVINKDGELWLDRTQVSLDELRDKASTTEKESFQIDADKDVPYTKVSEVVEVLSAAGVTELSFVHAQLGDGKYRIANRQDSYKFDDKHRFSMCKPSERPHYFTVVWPADGNRPMCTLRTYPNVSDYASGKWAVAWEPGANVLWWVDDTDVGKMNLTDPAAVILNRENRLSKNFSNEFGLPDELKREFRRLGFAIGQSAETSLEKTASEQDRSQSIVSAECWHWIIEGTVHDSDGQPLQDVTIRASSNEEIRTVVTDQLGKYHLYFPLSLRQLSTWRGVKVEPILEGYVERDGAKSGEFNALLYAGERPQRVRITGDANFKAGPIPPFAEKDIVRLPQDGAKSGTADFVMVKAADK